MTSSQKIFSSRSRKDIKSNPCLTLSPVLSPSSHRPETALLLPD